MKMLTDNCETVESCLAILQRCTTLIETTSDEEYTTVVLGESSIGAHIRHSLDHFYSFFKGLDTGRCDYDSRDRNPLIETDRGFALKKVVELSSKLSKLQETSESLQITQLYHCESPVIQIESTVQRELMFLMHHTLHHLALIAFLMKVQGLEVDQKLTLAFGTEKLQNEMIG